MLVHLRTPSGTGAPGACPRGVTGHGCSRKRRRERAGCALALGQPHKSLFPSGLTRSHRWERGASASPATAPAPAPRKPPACPCCLGSTWQPGSVGLGRALGEPAPRFHAGAARPFQPARCRTQLPGGCGARGVGAAALRGRGCLCALPGVQAGLGGSWDTLHMSPQPACTTPHPASPCPSFCFPSLPREWAYVYAGGLQKGIGERGQHQGPAVGVGVPPCPWGPGLILPRMGLCATRGQAGEQGPWQGQVGVARGRHPSAAGRAPGVQGAPRPGIPSRAGGLALCAPGLEPGQVGGTGWAQGQWGAPRPWLGGAPHPRCAARPTQPLARGLPVLPSAGCRGHGRSGTGRSCVLNAHPACWAWVACSLAHSLAGHPSLCCAGCPPCRPAQPWLGVRLGCPISLLTASTDTAYPPPHPVGV